jgi:2-polyprenyl-3-methyl-5-hydroxy-6-metoxy-1,4-benzoquinol methylase
MTHCPACLSSDTESLFVVSAEDAAQLLVIKEGPFRERHDALVSLIRKKWQGDQCEMRVCRSCKFGFASPFVAGDAEFYNLAYPAVRYPKRKWEFTKTLEVLRTLKTHGTTALDIAAGHGAFFDLCVPEVFAIDAVTATEFSDHSVHVLRRKGYTAIRADVRAPELRAERRRFDFIFLFQVIEHMDDLDGLFMSLAGLSKPGGSIFIAVPNVRWIAYREATGSLWDLPPTHIGRWTPEAFRAVASRHGLSLKAYEIEPFSAKAFIREDLIFSHFARAMRHGSFANRARSLKSKTFRLLVETIETITLASVRLGPLATGIRQRNWMGGAALWVRMENGAG